MTKLDKRSSVAAPRGAGRPCSVCSSRERAQVEKALADGRSISAISEQWQLSRSSLYRHIRVHWSAGMRAALRDNDGFDYHDLIGRLLDIANDARLIRRTALEGGDRRTAILAGDAEIRGLTAISARLGHEDLDLLKGLEEGRTLASIVGNLSRRYPRLGGMFVDELREKGADELATALDNLVSAQIERTTS